MGFRARVDFLWFSEGDEISDGDIQENWIENNLVEKVSKSVEVKSEPVEEAEVIEEESTDDSDSFVVELQNIKGIGKKTAEDIEKVFPNINILKSAFERDDVDFPFRDDVVVKLRKHYNS